MTLKIGIPIWIGNTLNTDVEALVSKIVKYGVEVIEVSIDYPWPYKYIDKLFQLLKFTEKYGLQLGYHAPWRDVPFATPYKILGEAAVVLLADIINKVVKYTSQDTYVVVHPLTMQKIELFDNRTDIVERLKRNIVKLTSNISDKLTVLLENLSRGFASEPAYLREAIINVGEKVGLCLDIGHLASRFYRELSDRYNDFYEYLDETVKIIDDINVKTIHVHDVDNKGAEHLVLGEGVLEFKKIYKIISKVNPEYLIYEMFRSRKKNLSLDEVLKMIRGQKSWAKIYIH